MVAFVRSRCYSVVHIESDAPSVAVAPNILSPAGCILGGRGRVVRLGCWCWRIHGGALVLDISHVAIVVISRVGDCLHTAVREVHRVGASHHLGREGQG